MGESAYATRPGAASLAWGRLPTQTRGPLHGCLDRYLAQAGRREKSGRGAITMDGSLDRSGSYRSTTIRRAPGPRRRRSGTIAHKYPNAAWHHAYSTPDNPIIAIRPNALIDNNQRTAMSGLAESSAPSAGSPKYITQITRR